MEEIFVTIDGYSKYEISNLGSVKRKSRMLSRNRDGQVSSFPLKERLLKPQINPNGYLQIMLEDDNGVKRLLYVHRIVAQMFIDNPRGFKDVRHINGNKTDNSVTNLEWGVRRKKKPYDAFNSSTWQIYKEELKKHLRQP